MKRFFIHTFGCQMNEYDSERIASDLKAQGWSLAPEAGSADLLLANTCTVRKLAEDKVFSLLGRWAQLKEQRPKLVVGMVGCLAQHLQQDAIKRAKVIDFLAGPRALSAIPELAEQARLGKPTSQFDLSQPDFIPRFDPSPSPVSIFLAVMDGCDQFCTYCAVPKARGRERSRPLTAILRELEHRAAQGAREVIFLGQNINRYGLDLTPSKTLVDLLEAAAWVPGLLRIRLMTGHPKDFTSEMIEALARVPQVCEALHLPLQSGSDKILAKMHRGYTSAQYASLIERLRATIPNIAISTDIIVGFPGETEEDFQATLRLVDQIGFDSAYTFKFSPRAATPAAQYPDQIPLVLKAERMARLLQRLEDFAGQKKLSLVNTVRSVLIERVDPKREGRLQGRTRANELVNVAGPSAWIGQERMVRITAAGPWCAWGEDVLLGGTIAAQTERSQTVLA